MAKRNRETLKNYFKKGARPSEQDFADLVDSSLNILDDGFVKEPEKGIEISPISGHETLISFFRETICATPQWEIAIDKQSGNLQIHRVTGTEKKVLMELGADGSLQMGETGNNISFSGNVEASSFTGTLLKGALPADGRWHDLLEAGEAGELVTKAWSGCQALQLTASAGITGAGKHAVLVAVATTCFGAGSRIKKISSHYGSYGNRICLRWRKMKEEKYTCKLQLKTILKYDEEAVIYYSITSLLNR